MKALLCWFCPPAAELSDPAFERRFITRCLGISLVLHLITAWFSVGYQAADEQFQILEFLSYKLGGAPAGNLPIEFSERMRPWLQPGIYWVLVQLQKGLGIQNPFTWAISFRVFTGLLGWLGLVTFAQLSRTWFQDLRARRFAFLALTWLWFLPALHVRPSSESLGASAFLLGFGLACLKIQKRLRLGNWIWVAVGILLGISFEARFQMALMILGFFGWLLVFRKSLPAPLNGWREWGRAISLGFLGLAIMIVLGRIVDYWGYGEWCLSPYNYFVYNLVRGEVSRFGNSPWWDVFRMSFTEVWPFLGLGVALCSVIAWLRHPKHPLTWSLVPFALVHLWISHKELRFFFPIAAAAPILVPLCFYSNRTHEFGISSIGFSENLWKWLKWPWKFLLLNNGVALLVLMVIPFSRTIEFYEGVYNRAGAGAGEFELFVDRNPYQILGNPVYFYQPPKLKISHFKNFEELAQRNKSRIKPYWLAYPGLEIPESAAVLFPRCEKVFQSLPAISKGLNFGNWIERTHVWVLYRCDGAAPVTSRLTSAMRF